MSNFTFLLRVRYSECDSQNIVFNANYADVAATEFTREIWGDYHKLLERGIENRVIKLTINWSAPAHFDDVLAISVTASQIGNSSYTLELSFAQHATGTPVAQAEIVYVMVNTQDFNKMTIPEDLRTRLHKGATDVTVNHAGV